MSIVVKVGGSLYDWPQLGSTLSRWLRDNAPEETLIVPGGGSFVEKLRSGAEQQGLSDEQTHWLALEGMKLGAELLRTLLGSEYDILDPVAFGHGDHELPGALPHSWSATSDSIAARMAEYVLADLVLLKSADPPAGSVTDWAASGFVDPFFPRIVERAKLNVRSVNLRTY